MVSISVLLCTARGDFPVIGLPDMHVFYPTFEALLQQTFKDFEVIVVDALYPQRKEWLDRKWGFPVKYVPVHPNHRFWLDRKRWSICASLNTAILHAEGELLVRIDDCSEFDPLFLQKFWDGYRSGYFPLAMHVRYLEGKPARFDKEYMEKGYEALHSVTSEKDERSKILHRLYGDEGLVRDTRYPIVKSRGGRMVAPDQWFYGYSSLSLEAALKVNGFNELFDGDKCFPPDQLVYLQNEMKPIEQVKVGEFVLTHKGRLKKVTKIHKRWYEGEVFTLSVCGGSSITMTPGHLVLARYPRETSAKSVFGNVYRSQTGWVKARELVNAYLKVSRFASHRRKFRMLFTAPKTNTWTEHVNLGSYKLKLTRNLARLIGYYVAEGSAGRYLQFSLNETEADYAEDILELCNHDLAFLKSRLPNEKHGSITRYPESHSIEVKYHVCREFGVLWKKWLGHNAHEKHIPYEILYGADNEVCNQFLTGLWRGDGSGHKYVTASPQLAYQVQLLLGRMGKYARINRRIQNNGYGKGKTIYHVEISHAKQRLHVKKTSHLTFSNGEEVRGHFFYRPIRKVEATHYKGFVYHLKVEDDESYQVHGITVHNSQEDQECGLRLTMAGYKDMFILDVNHQVIEHEHVPIPSDVVTPNQGNIKCNYSLFLLSKNKNRWLANSQKLTEDEVEFVRQESLKPPCSPRPNFYEDDCRGKLFDLWLSGQNLFDLREERMSI